MGTSPRAVFMALLTPPPPFIPCLLTLWGSGQLLSTTLVCSEAQRVCKLHPPEAQRMPVLFATPNKRSQSP